jgi:hypothetical protein
LRCNVKAFFSLIGIVLLAGCEQSTSSTDSLPTGTEAPRLTLTVLSGTKANPVDSPSVKVAWAHKDADSLYMDYLVAFTNNRDSIGINCDKSGVYACGSGVFVSTADTVITGACGSHDSVFVMIDAWGYVDSGATLYALDSTWVFCK